jgi:DNA-binding GntR family transcriptional regulator
VQQRARAQAVVDFTDDARAHAAVFTDINRGDPVAAAESMLAVVLDGKNALIEALSTLNES